MKPHQNKYPQPGDNPYGKGGDYAGICKKCKEPVPVKTGFRASQLKCPKCGTLLGK